MSRNLYDLECHRCKAPKVSIVGPTRRGTREDFGRYAQEYMGMAVADAECPRCQAKYLAWVSNLPYAGERAWALGEYGYQDLSYRSTFNDEPGPDDLPKPKILIELDTFLASASRPMPVVQMARDFLAEMLGWS
jgi:hypothetical protein